jgi:hypothetical protein
MVLEVRVKFSERICIQQAAVLNSKKPSLSQMYGIRNHMRL